MILTGLLPAWRLDGPGLLLTIGVAVAAVLAEPLLKQATGGMVSLPAMVIALLIGIALSNLAQREVFRPGLAYCVKKLLRYAIALLGLKIALADITALGASVIGIVIVAMAVTIAGSIFLSRRLGTGDGLGALCGAASAVCGASATLATATVVPAYPGKSADVAFAVVAANLLSTVVMLAYPPLAHWLGFSNQHTGILLGATIHDMAQVVGSSYAISDAVGNTAVVVKLFRVFLLLPIVLLIGLWFTRTAGASAEAKVPFPTFALVFIGLAGLNSIAPALPGFAGLFAAMKPLLIQASSYGLLISIAALGLGTSVTSLRSIGWRHALIFGSATVLIFGIVCGGLLILE